MSETNTQHGEAALFHRKPPVWRYHLAAAISILGLIYGVWRWTITPHVNPNPTQKVVVHGEFPYDRGWDLKIQSSYYTTNPDCDVSARAFLFFSAAEVAREVWVDHPVTRKDGNRYEVSLHRDHFEPGYCGWQLRYIYSHKFIDGAWEHGSDAIMGLGREFNQINYECYYMDSLTPGRGRDARERSIVCSNYRRPNNNFDSHIKGNELNFVFNSKVRYDYYDANGKIQSMWKEGEQQ